MKAKEWAATPWGATPEARRLLADFAACEAERDEWKELAEVSGFDLSIRAERDRLRDEVVGWKKDAIGGDGETHWYYRDEYERVVAERDDLRRKLEEAEREKNLAIVEAVGHEHSEGHLDDLVDELRADLDREKAESDKAVKELRGRLAEERLANSALRGALESLRPVVNEPYDWEPDPVAYGKAIDAALALPTDGLAEEVRHHLIDHRSNMEKANAVAGDGRFTVTIASLDALLARIGGKP